MRAGRQREAARARGGVEEAARWSRSSSGTSSRKASWPLSVSISTKETDAPPAFSACTMARESEVGNSQSEVKETTQKRVLRALEGVGQHAAVVGREVEIIHGARHVEIGIGVEPLDEAAALVAQVALDLEIGVEGEGRRGAVLQLAAEFARAAPASDR